MSVDGIHGSVCLWIDIAPYYIPLSLYLCIWCTDLCIDGLLQCVVKDDTRVRLGTDWDSHLTQSSDRRSYKYFNSHHH